MVAVVATNRASAASVIPCMCRIPANIQSIARGQATSSSDHAPAAGDVAASAIAATVAANASGTRQFKQRCITVIRCLSSSPSGPLIPVRDGNLALDFPWYRCRPHARREGSAELGR
jgi:hypothetical protein